MLVLRLALAAHLAALTIYTAIVIANHGIDLLPVFFGDMGQMGWPGQFNLDFMGFPRCGRPGATIFRRRGWRSRSSPSSAA